MPYETEGSATVRAGSRTGRRRTAFRVIAWIMAASGMAFGLFTAVFGVIEEEQRIHAFHNVVVAALLIVLSASAAFGAARDPEGATRALVHLAVVGVAGVVTMAFAVTLDPFTLPFVVLVAVLWVLRPGREDPLGAGRPSLILLAIVIVGAVPLVAYALGQAELQRIDDSSEHAEFFHWVEAAFYSTAIPLLGLLAALRPAAYRLSGWSAGLALAVAGVASLLLRGYPSALEVSWAWAAVAGSLVFVAVLEWEARRPRLSPG